MIQLVGFDGDDTLWRSEDYYQHAGAEFERILAPWIDIRDPVVRGRLQAVERANLALFGYGAKGMTLSMVEAAIDLTRGAVTSSAIHEIVGLGKAALVHPVELLPGIRAAVEAVAASHRIVLITKGDLFHQERKIEQSGLGHLFHRIEIVSEKDARSYARVIDECGAVASGFAMIGNSLRSDIEPVIGLGGWGIHMPYHVTWAHEMQHGVEGSHPRVITIDSADQIPEALRRCV
jgi:putative hydrolase of the HAD superfamily